MKDDTPPPTIEEVRAAKKVLRRWYKAHPRKRRHFRVRTLSPAEQKFSTWRHDFGVLLEASARVPGLAPVEIVKRAEAAADEMSKAVAARKPASYPGHRAGFLSRYIVRKASPRRQWLEWQTMFDQIVHNLSPQTALAPGDVVERATLIADLATSLIEIRRMRAVVKVAA